jgi:hypothetical protein
MLQIKRNKKINIPYIPLNINLLKYSDNGPKDISPEGCKKRPIKKNKVNNM